jgi:ribonuclease-3
MTLQETASREFSAAPEYRVSSQGPDHAKEFTATVFLRGEPYGGGQGRSKKEAEQHAAHEALERIAAQGDDDGGES